MTRLSQGIRPLGIGIIIIDHQGEILFSQMPGIESSGNIVDFIDIEAFNRISHAISYMDGNMVRRVDAEEYTTLFFGADYNGYEILMRDMWRFWVFNMLLLIPIWFLIQMYIRRVLRPVQENIDTMTHFVHDAGHELKTPLAIISGNLQIMRDSVRTDYDLIEESLSTIDAMNESIQGLLELADLKMPQHNEKTHLNHLISQEMKRANNHKNVTIRSDIPEKVMIAASEKHLSILIRNLLENAIKYNKEQGSVSISFKKNTLTIQDTGIGMETEDIARIFDRFYRINKHSDQKGS